MAAPGHIQHNTRPRPPKNRAVTAILRTTAGIVGILFSLSIVGGISTGDTDFAGYAVILTLAIPALYYAFWRPARLRKWSRDHPGQPLSSKRRAAWIAGTVFTVFAITAVDNAVNPEASVGVNRATRESTAAQQSKNRPSTPSPAPTNHVETALPVTPLYPSTKTPADAERAVNKLQTLFVKGRAPATGFNQARFGDLWTDDVEIVGGHNGCDTRNDILRRDLTDIVLRSGSNGCAVASGRLHDPYTGMSIDYATGSTTGDITVDHVVALADAWQTGAQQLDDATLRTFANDPINLQATATSTADQKRDANAAAWLPSDSTYRCTYVARQIDIKSTYHLWVTQAEHDAIQRVLVDCGATLPPTTTAAPAIPSAPVPVPVTPAPVVTSRAAPPPPPPPGPTYRSAPQTGDSEYGGGCGDGYYENSAGNCIPSPNSDTTGATARCKDGTFSHSRSRRGTCSSHGGVAEWL